MSDRQLASAILREDTEAIKLLLSTGNVNINAPADAAAFVPSNRALGLAILCGRVNSVFLLLEHGADANVQEESGFVALHQAVFNRSEEADNVALTLALLQKGANPNIQTRSGMTPLHLACFFNKIHVGRVLLENGADMMMKKSVSGRTVLDMSVTRTNGSPNDTGFLRLLLEKGGNANYQRRHKYSQSLLHEAARVDHSEHVKLLLEFGADPKVRNCRLRVPLEMACQESSTGCIFLLFQRMIADGSISLKRNRNKKRKRED